MSDSKKVKAVSELFEQQTKLETINSLEFDVWIVKTTQIIKTFLGDDSEFYKRMKQFNFTKKYDKNSNVKQDILVNIAIAHGILVSCMEHIDNHGIYEKPSDNFLSKIKANWFVALVFTGGTIVFSAGWFFSNMNSRSDIKDLQNSIKQMQSKINELRDSIRLYRPSDSIPDKQTKPPSKKGQ